MIWKGNAEGRSALFFMTFLNHRNLLSKPKRNSYDDDTCSQLKRWGVQFKAPVIKVVLSESNEGRRSGIAPAATR